MPKHACDPYTVDPGHRRRGSPSHTNVNLPHLRDILSDLLEQPPPGRVRLSRAPYPHAQRSNPRGVRNQRPDLPPIARHSRHSSRSDTNHSIPSSNNLYTHSRTSQPLPPPYSSDPLSSPNQGVIHQRSSARGDLNESIAKRSLRGLSDPKRKHVCAECGDRFLKLSNLKDHLRTHSGERPFACGHPGCGQRFSIASNMQRHMRTHTSASTFEIDTTDDGDRDTLTRRTTQSSSRGGSSLEGSSRGSFRDGPPEPYHYLWASSSPHERKS
ncbi:hypothetical protein JB92DRAFT_2880154 [Gautieria morchelliformis]|nr:hypothetical protein JB92DRAFT_2880154 [Gautieria morchelliformis]